MNVSLSDGEWKLMNRLWEHAPRTITELTAALREETGWSKNTIITMLSRLEAKGAVTHTEGQRAKLSLIHISWRRSMPGSPYRGGAHRHPARSCRWHERKRQRA